MQIIYKIHFFKSAFGKGLEGIKVMGKILSFSVLKHKLKVGVDVIFCIILTTLLSKHIFVHIFLLTHFVTQKKFKKISVGRFYGGTSRIFCGIACAQLAATV